MKSRRATYLACLLLVAAVLWWLLPGWDGHPGSGTVETGAAERQRPAKVEKMVSVPVGADLPASAAAAPITEAGSREMRAYRLAVRGGVVSLDAVESIVGDFHRRRGPLAWMPGLWCVRVLDADMRVLAEETAAAPDDVCVVVDPQNVGASGAPQVTQFAGAGEEAMLQVRMPPQPGAKWLKVYRLSGMQRADWNTEPMGQLLASISLP